jgi:hypothetical protein
MTSSLDWGLYVMMFSEAMAVNGDHEAVGFTQHGGRIIATVAASVCPTGWAFKITNRFDSSATVLLFRPDKSEYSEIVDYADIVSWKIRTARRLLPHGDEVWWEHKLRDTAMSATGGSPA